MGDVTATVERPAVLALLGVDEFVVDLGGADGWDVANAFGDLGHDRFQCLNEPHTQRGTTDWTCEPADPSGPASEC